MARKHAKILLGRFETAHTHEGTSRCAVVKLKGTTQWDNPIGRICEAPGGYEYGYVGSAGGRAIHGPKKTKAAAIRSVVKGYKSWIG
jgi:hypothetical protein